MILFLISYLESDKFERFVDSFINNPNDTIPDKYIS